jgi:hypothetical protein
MTELKRGPNTWPPVSPDLILHNFFLPAFTVGRTQSCKFSAIWSIASLLVMHSTTGFVGTGQVDEPPGSLDLTIAKFFPWDFVIGAVLGCNGQVPL